MANQRYIELLRDPRWQRRKSEALLAADCKCQRCGDTRTTLNVHHPAYIRGRMPWEYDNSELMVLCEPCHKDQHDLSEGALRLQHIERQMVRAHAAGKWDEMMEWAEQGRQLVESGVRYRWLV